MAESCGYTLLATIVEGYDTTVAEWQLYASLALLACYLSRNRTVNLVCQPVLASHGFKLQHAVKVFVNLVLVVFHVVVMALNSSVHHHSLWRVAEHLCHVEVERSDTVSLLEGEVCVACCFTYYI